MKAKFFGRNFYANALPMLKSIPLLTTLAKKLHVITEATVTEIDRQAGLWHVSSKEHGLYSEHYDDVVLAILAPQAAALNQAANNLFTI